MASISNKNAARPTQLGTLQAKQHVIKNSANSKSGQNKKSGQWGQQQAKMGLEILDFHESWLEEMESYKDKLFMQKREMQMLNSGSKPEGLDERSADDKRRTGDAAIKYPGSIYSYEESVYGKGGNDRKKSSPKSANRIKGKGENTQTLLKHIRETNPTGNADSNSPYKGAVSHDANSLPYKSPGPVPNSTVITSPKKLASIFPGPMSMSAPNKQFGNIPPATNPTLKSKIFVDHFLGRNQLHAQQQEKNKIFTLNGLSGPAANAYDRCLYTSDFQRDRGSDGRVFYGGGYSSYGMTTTHDPFRKKRYEDDPGAAIDDVNDFSDTDSDEEYTGQPFYLDSDADETHQSQNIRQYSEDTLNSDMTLSDRSEYYKPKCVLSPSLFPNVPPYLNFSSHADRGPPMPPSLRRVLKWKLSPVMPRIVKRIVLNSGYRIIKNTTDWMAIWENHMKSPSFRTIRSHQKFNHLPGSFRIGRKDSMWRSIQSNMKRFGSKEFGFMQKTYIMPDDLETLRRVWPKNASRLTKWIVKPPASARGTGIRIVNKWSQFPKDRPLVVQKYIERPLLINDSKFDMRVYVVLTSVNPMRIYMCKDGLARFASVKYSSELTSLDERCMHLTNYSINKNSQNYSKNVDFNACQGHKWTLQSLWSCLEARGVNTKRLWATLRNLVIKAFITGEAGLNRVYRQNVNFRNNCFELFGFDILLDENLVPWLLEINVSPSLHSELPLDLHVKGPLLQATMNCALYQVPPKLTDSKQKEILDALDLTGPLCYDKRLFTTCLTSEEIRKHNQFTNRSVKFREEYLDLILENLQPDDVRCLVISEDELNRSKPLERVFPTANSHIYLKFFDTPRYYNRLMDAWEHKYGHCRELGIKLLRQYCEEGYHLKVSNDTCEKEPNVTITDIDMLHVKKSERDDLQIHSQFSSQPQSNSQSQSTSQSQSLTPPHTQIHYSAVSTVRQPFNLDKSSPPPSSRQSSSQRTSHSLNQGSTTSSDISPTPPQNDKE